MATIRAAAAADREGIALVIRKVMPEFGAGGAGFAIHDPEVDDMPAAYGRPRHRYWVVDDHGRILGGAGYGPLAGAGVDICELRKMYLLSDARGQGHGRALLELAISAALGDGFRQMYLETLTGMDVAQALYQRLGFAPICGPLGATGHYGCDRYYLREL